MLRPDNAADRKDTQEHIPPGARSPHPYRRQSIDIPDRLFVTNLAARDRQPQQSHNSTRVPRIARNDSDISDYFSRDRGSRRATLTTSPSDSGTEADDEKPYLKGLPPARGKPRKGLKGASGAVTPSDFDGISDALLVDGGAGQARASDTPLQASAVLSKEQVDRYRKKWRSELLRRVFEVCFVSGLTLLGLTVETEAYGGRSLSTQEEADVHTLKRARRICGASVTIPALYFIWLLQRHVRAWGGSGRNALRQLPLPSDPARFLYPFMIPTCITAFSTTTWRSRSGPLRANLVLGVASCWSSGQMAAFLKGQRGSELQWLSAIVTVTGLPLSDADGEKTRDVELDSLMFLFPLLAALAPTLQYFCGSSLLTAETKLLSIGLINLLYFASAPQAMILFCLMWIGGICLLASCRHIMKWSTMLARIPGWRFRSPRHTNASARNAAGSSAIATILQTSSFLPDPRGHDSSDERDRVIDDFSREQDDLGLGPSGVQNKADTLKATVRRHTFSGAATRSNSIRTIDTTTRERKQRRRPFLWMTRMQAAILKWAYALYCYVMVIAIIILPVRSYIQINALKGEEPIGWALGYLFGNLQPFRLHVVLSELDSWITLPPRLDIVKDPGLLVFDNLRHHTFGAANTRLAIAGWCVANLALGIAAVLQLRSLVEVDTRRKVFHGMMVSMFLPTIFIDPCFVALALTLMLVIFLLLDLFRAAQLPPISKPLTHFLAPYVDGRDHKGPIVISPIFLLIGCAIPLWLSLASMDRGSETILDPSNPWYAWELPRRDLSMVAGVICVGMGDAAASLIGRRYGRRRWIWSGGKSLEGSAAFVVAVMAGLSTAEVWRRLGGWQSEHASSRLHAGVSRDHDPALLFLGKTALAGAGASFTEAVLTGGNDNVIVPVVLWLLVRLLKI